METDGEMSTILRKYIDYKIGLISLDALQKFTRTFFFANQNIADKYQIKENFSSLDSISKFIDQYYELNKGQLDRFCKDYE